MRFRQFGHQVPRKNSRISFPRCRNPDSVKMPWRLAGSRVNSGAREPTCRVSVRSCICLLTVKQHIERNNRGRRKGTMRGTWARAGWERCGERCVGRKRASCEEFATWPLSASQEQWLVHGSGRARAHSCRQGAAKRSALAADGCLSTLTRLLPP